MAKITNKQELSIKSFIFKNLVKTKDEELILSRVANEFSKEETKYAKSSLSNWLNEYNTPEKQYSVWLVNWDKYPEDRDENEYPMKTFETMFLEFPNNEVIMLLPPEIRKDYNVISARITPDNKILSINGITVLPKSKFQIDTINKAYLNDGKTAFRDAGEKQDIQDLIKDKFLTPSKQLKNYSR